MKRNVISLLLALVLVFAVTVALAPTAEAAATAPTHHVHDAGVHDGWTQLKGNSISITAPGNYYVSGSLGTAITFSENLGDVVFCLNGGTLRGNNPINGVPAGTTLTICDCSSEGKGVVASSQKNNNSQVIKVTGGTVNLISGTVDGNFVLNSVTNLNRCVYMTSGTFNMWGGTLQEGTSTGHGGTVYMTGGTFNMYNGIITSGVAGTSSKGGNVMMLVQSGTATFNMYDGTISGGEAQNGGNVALNAMTNAGATAAFNMYGGSISGGTATANGDNVWIHSVSGVTNQLTVGGTSKICDSGVENVYLSGTNSSLLVSTETALTAPASIGVTLKSGITSFASGAAETDAQYFFDDADEMDVTYSKGALVLTERVAPHTHCWCVGAIDAPEHDCVDIVYTAHSGSGNAPAAFTTDCTAIHLGDKESIGTITFGQGVTECYLCLCGNVARGNTPVSAPAGVTLYITNCQGNGRIAGTNSNSNTAAVEVDGGTVNFMSGTLEGQFKMSATDIRSNRNVDISSGAFNMYGGTIQNGWIDIGSGNGGNIYMTGGELNIYAGTITGGVADATAVNASNMENRGGNIYASGGEINISGGTISGGYAETVGGNIWTSSKVTATVTGGEISNGTGGNSQKSANWHVDGSDVTITNATFSLNDSTQTNIRVAGANGAVTLGSGATLTGGAYGLYVGNGTGTLQNNPTITAATAQLMVGANASGKIVADASLTEDYTLDISGTLTEGRLMVEDADGVNGTFVCPENAVSSLTWKPAEGENLAGWYIGELTIAAKVGDLTFKTLELAAEYAVANEAVVTLQTDVEEDIDVEGTLTLNLNGCTITGNVSADKLEAFDSANNGYDANACGKIVGFVNGLSEEYMRVTDTARRRYVTITDTTGATPVTSFHRIYVAVTAVSLVPSTTDVKYSLAFLGDETVAQYLGEFGINLEIETAKDVKFTGFKAVSADDVKNENLTNYTQKTMGLEGTFKDTLSAAENEARANLDVKATAYMIINGYRVESAQASSSMRSLVEGANAAIDSENPPKAAAIKALQAMCTKWTDVMGSWNISNITGWTENA